MTPQEEELQAQLIGLPVIKELKEADKEIIEDLEGIKKGQATLAQFVSEGFAKGKDRMDGLETMFKDHINTTKENHKEAMSAYTDLKGEIKDNKIKDMTQDLTKTREEIKTYRERVWWFVKMVFTGVFGLVLGALAVYFGIK